MNQPEAIDEPTEPAIPTESMQGSIEDTADNEDRPLRIAFVTRQYPPDSGGIGTYVRTISRWLAQDGHLVTVIVPSVRGRGKVAVEEGVEIRWIPVIGPRRLLAWASAKIRFLKQLDAAINTAWAVLVTRQKFDVLECTEYRAEGLLLRYLRRGAIVIHLHLAIEIVHAWMSTVSSWGIAYKFERQTARNGHAVTATTQMTRQLPDGRLWLPEVNVQIVPPPIDCSVWSHTSDIRETPPTVLFLGHLGPRKAPDILLTALELIQQQVPDLRCLFVGNPGAPLEGVPSDIWIHQRAEEMGLDCTVHPATSQYEVAQHLASSRVLAVPSRYESLSMVVFEAFAAGRPAIMTTQTGASEFFRDHLPESVVPAEDPKALADALLPLLLDPMAAFRLAEKGRSIVQTVCSPEASVNRRVKIYRDLLRSEPR